MLYKFNLHDQAAKSKELYESEFFKQSQFAVVIKAASCRGPWINPALAQSQVGDFEPVILSKT